MSILYLAMCQAPVNTSCSTGQLQSMDRPCFVSGYASNYTRTNTISNNSVFFCFFSSDVFRSGNAMNRVSTTLWHHDQSFERQPPSATFLTGLTIPARSGGDTEYVSMVAAYNRLSPSFREYLETLTVVHSGVEQAEASINGGSGILRRPAVETVHPVVRVHPGTGEKALFVNKAFTKYIIGLKQEESDTILNFLYDFIAKATEFHARVRWEDATVIVWDKYDCTSLFNPYRKKAC